MWHGSLRGMTAGNLLSIRWKIVQDIDEDARRLFTSGGSGVHEVQPPSAEQRRAFFRPVAEALAFHHQLQGKQAKRPPPPPKARMTMRLCSNIARKACVNS